MAIVSKSKVKYIYLLRNYQGGYPIHAGLQFGFDQKNFNNFFKGGVKKNQVFELVNFDPKQCDYYSEIAWNRIGIAQHKSYEQVNSNDLKKYLDDIAKYKIFQFFLFRDKSGNVNNEFDKGISVDIDSLYPKNENGKITDENITEIRLKKESNLGLELNDTIKIEGTDFDGIYEVKDLLPNKNSVKSIYINKKSGLPITGKKYDNAKLYYTYTGNGGAIKTFQLVPSTVMIVPKNDVYIYKHDYVVDKPTRNEWGRNRSGEHVVNVLKESRPKIDTTQRCYNYIEQTMKEIIVDKNGDFSEVIKETTRIPDFLNMYSDNYAWYIKGMACYNTFRYALEENDRARNLHTYFGTNQQLNRDIAEEIFSNLDEIAKNYLDKEKKIKDWRKKTKFEKSWHKAKTGLLAPLRLIIQITIENNLFGFGKALYNLKVQKPEKYETKFRNLFYNLGGNRTNLDKWVNKNKNFDGFTNIFQEFENFESFSSNKELEDYIRNKVHEHEYYLFSDGSNEESELKESENELELKAKEAQELANKLSKITIDDIQRVARNSIEVQEILKSMKENKNADGDDDYIKLPVGIGYLASFLAITIEPKTSPWAKPAGTVIDTTSNLINTTKILKKNPKKESSSTQNTQKTQNTPNTPNTQNTQNTPNTPNTQNTQNKEIDKDKIIKNIAIAVFVIASAIVAGILYNNMNEK